MNRFLDVSSFNLSDLKQVEKYINDLCDDLAFELQSCAISELSKIRNLNHTLFGGFIKLRLDTLTQQINSSSEYGITIPEDDVENLKTVGDIVTELEKISK